jgi:hypothetical protein
VRLGSCKVVVVVQVAKPAVWLCSYSAGHVTFPTPLANELHFGNLILASLRTCRPPIHLERHTMAVDIFLPTSATSTGRLSYESHYQYIPSFFKDSPATHQGQNKLAVVLSVL